MKWQDKLTKDELKHVREWVGSTLTAFKKQVKFLTKEQKTRGNDFSAPCYTCKVIARKLGLIK